MIIIECGLEGSIGIECLPVPGPSDGKVEQSSITQCAKKLFHGKLGRTYTCQEIR